MAGRTTSEDELFEAVDNNKLDEVQNLLRRTADVRTKDEDGATVLHLAALRGQEGVVQALMKADTWNEIINIKDALGQTALHNCCMRGHTATVQLLLENGADATAADQAGWTALHHAADEGELEVVKCLAKHMKEHKMDFNQKTSTTGGTALHIAVDRGFAAVVDELLKNGASNTATTWDGDTILHWALRGAITEEHGPNDEDEAGDRAHDDDLNDETADFDDDDDDDDNNDGRSVRFLNRHQEGSAKDKEDQYDKVFEHILRGMNDKTKWSELLKVARREEEMKTLQYLMSKMYPRQIPKGLQNRLRRIWLAMSESRTQELMEILWTEAGKARTPERLARLQTEARLITGDTENWDIMKEWDSKEKWDVLSLATYLGKDKTVYWLLRGRRWSKSDIEKAKTLSGYRPLNAKVELSEHSRIWHTPFVHDERSRGESYRWPDIRQIWSDHYGFPQG